MGKRFWLILVGTFGGLGSVLFITPPQFTSNTGLSLGKGLTPPASTPTPVPSSPNTLQTPTPSAIASQASDPVASPSQSSVPPPSAVKHPKKHKAAKKNTKAKTPAAPKPTPAAPKPTPAPTPSKAGVSGTFTGNSANTAYGPVQVQITVINNKITNATALVYPNSSFRDQQINAQAIPYLIQETLQAQSANIQGVGGASYTSQGWAGSLQSALSKAGL